MHTNAKYTLFRRGGIYYSQDSATGQQKSLRTRDETEGLKLITDLERVCPGVSRDMIRLWLRDLKAAGRIERLGRGSGSKWRKMVMS
jgi:predicted transcriptional regulator of viral defense system